MTPGGTAMNATQTREAAIAADVIARLAGLPESAPDGWEPVSLNEGSSGLALLYATDPDARRITHAHLTAALRGHTSTAPATLYYGDAALGFAARVAAGGTGHYANLLSAVDERVATSSRQLAATLTANLATGQPVQARHYDLILGLAGLARYLLAASPAHRPALDDALTALLTLTEHPPANLGMAHGLAGVLALLAIAHRQGARIPGQAETIARTADHLASQLVTGEHGPFWPYLAAPAPAATRAAWCYGTPGVARALQLASMALGDSGWADLGVRTLRAVLAGPREPWVIKDASLCHGAAGLLHVTGRVAADSGDPELAARLPALADLVLAHHDPDSRYGFRYRDKDGYADRAGFLEGAAGVALALRHHIGLAKDLPVPHWDAALLLT